MSRPDTADIGDLFVTKDHTTPALELKGSVFTLTVLRIQRPHLPDIEVELKGRIAQGPRFFENAPVVVDLEQIKDEADALDFPALVKMIRSHGLFPVGLRHGTPQQQAQAAANAVAVMKGGAIQDLPTTRRNRSSDAESRKNKPQASSSPAPAAEAGGYRPTKVIRQPVRSGQQIYAPDGDLILLGAVNAGAEIIADGNIHVYAPLRGRALAGVKGDMDARIFCHCMEAELVAVAGHYQVFEERVPDNLYRQAVQIYLDDEKLMIEPLA